MAPPYLNHHSVFSYRHWGMQYGHPFWLHSIQTLYLTLQMGFIYLRGCLLMWIFFPLLIYILLRSLPTTWKWFECISFLRSKAHSYTIGHIVSQRGKPLRGLCFHVLWGQYHKSTFYSLLVVCSEYKDMLKCLEIVGCGREAGSPGVGRRSAGLGIGQTKKYSWLYYWKVFKLYQSSSSSIKQEN